MYPVIEVANYIINKCIELGRGISNLQLQKILYYVQGELMMYNIEEELFEEDIEAWQYGPVVPEVYYRFNNYSSSNINVCQPESDIAIEIRNIIDPIICKKSLLSAWKLVEQTHKEEPWSKSYDGNKNNVIDKEIMREYFHN